MEREIAMNAADLQHVPKFWTDYLHIDTSEQKVQGKKIADESGVKRWR